MLNQIDERRIRVRDVHGQGHHLTKDGVDVLVGTYNAADAVQQSQMCVRDPRSLRHSYTRLLFEASAGPANR
jgi:hypothetical protein